MFLMLTIACFGCLHCRDSRVPYVNHGMFYGCSRCCCLGSRVPCVNHGVLWLFTMSLLA